MDEYQVKEIFDLMGSKISGSGENKTAQCPLAQWNHSKGRDKNPSMTVKAGDPALCKCWSCDFKGTVKWLAKKYAELSGDSIAFNMAQSIEGEDKSMWGKLSQHKYGSYYQRLKKASDHIEKNKLKHTMTEDQLSEYMKLIPEYAFTRGLTEKDVIKYELGYDEKLKRMIIPVRDVTGKLVGVSGRDVTGVQKPKYKHYPGLKKEAVFYGEKWLNHGFTKASIVEGFWDVWSLLKLGVVNPLASMGTSLSQDQIRKIMKWCGAVDFYPDCDDAGAGLRFAIENGQKLCRLGIVVGICGVKYNEKYVEREKPVKWETIDYCVIPVDTLKGKDPGDYTKEDLDVASRNVKYFRYDQVLGVFKVE